MGFGHELACVVKLFAARAAARGCGGDGGVRPGVAGGCAACVRGVGEGEYCQVESGFSLESGPASPEGARRVSVGWAGAVVDRSIERN